MKIEPTFGKRSMALLQRIVSENGSRRWSPSRTGMAPFLRLSASLANRRGVAEVSKSVGASSSAYVDALSTDALLASVPQGIHSVGDDRFVEEAANSSGHSNSKRNLSVVLEERKPWSWETTNWSSSGATWPSFSCPWKDMSRRLLAGTMGAQSCHISPEQLILLLVLCK